MTASGSSGGRSPRSDVLATLQAVGLATVAVLPAFLTGALAIGMRADLDFGRDALGLAVAWFFVTSSLSATTLGKRVERLGLRTSLSLGAAGSTLALAGLGSAPRYSLLLVAMTVGGASNAITQPAVNALLAQRIPSARLGLAFGIKQSAIPAATLLGGVAVPTLAVAMGWRGAFFVAALLAALSSLGAWVRSDPASRLAGSRPRRRLRDMPEVASLVILSAGGLLGSAAATSLGAFLVDAGVDSGLTEAQAGLLTALASALGLLSRIGLGWYADLRPRRSRYGTITLLLALGAPGYLLLTLDQPLMYTVGAIIGYLAGWSWPGLFHFAVVSQNSGSPAATTGIVQTGVSLGAGLGPLAFGWIAERVSYDAAWLLAAALGALASATFLYGRRHLRRARHDASTSYLRELDAVTWNGEGEGGADGVQVRQLVTEHLHVTLYRTPPGVEHVTAASGRTGLAYVMAGDGAELVVEGASAAVPAGQHVPVPANRTWRVVNNGEHPLLVAHVEPLGNRMPPAGTDESFE